MQGFANFKEMETQNVPIHQSYRRHNESTHPSPLHFWVASSMSVFATRVPSYAMLQWVIQIFNIPNFDFYSCLKNVHSSLFNLYFNIAIK